MNLVYLSPLKKEVLEQALEDIKAQSTTVPEHQEHQEHQNDESDWFSDDEYRDEDTVIQAEDVKELEDFGLYDFDIDNLVTIKAARLTKDSHSPFAALSEPKERKRQSEFEYMCKTEKNMPYNEYKQNIRLGFIQAANDFKYAKVKPEKVKDLLGIAHKEFPIHRKKRFYQKKVGYIKLDIRNETANYYVEVVKGGKILKWLWWILIIIALLLSLRSCGMNDWNIDLNGLTPYKTESQTVEDISQLSIQHRADVENNNGSLNLALSSESIEGIAFQIKVYSADEESPFYESEMMAAGSHLATIPSPVGTSGNCILVCEVYKDSGQHIGQLKSYFNIK